MQFGFEGVARFFAPGAFDAVVLFAADGDGFVGDVGDAELQVAELFLQLAHGFFASLDFVAESADLGFDAFDVFAGFHFFADFLRGCFAFVAFFVELTGKGFALAVELENLLDVGFVVAGVEGFLNAVSLFADHTDVEHFYFPCCWMLSFKVGMLENFWVRIN